MFRDLFIFIELEFVRSGEFDDNLRFENLILLSRNNFNNFQEYSVVKYSMYIVSLTFYVAILSRETYHFSSN